VAHSAISKQADQFSRGVGTASTLRLSALLVRSAAGALVPAKALPGVTTVPASAAITPPTTNHRFALKEASFIDGLTSANSVLSGQSQGFSRTGSSPSATWPGAGRHRRNLIA
jgi:hypothetical protein